MKNIYYLIIWFGILLSSCQPTQSDALLPDEEQAERLLRESPDSLAMILEELIVPSELSDSARAEYGWWICRLHQQQRRNMVNDSIIHYTLHYYQEHHSSRLANAYVLAAMQINYAGERKEEANELLIKGMRVAESKKDTTLLINIASTLGYMNLFAGNLSVLGEDAKRMLFEYSAAEPWQKMDASYSLGCYYGNQNEPDSMEHYMLLAIRLAEELNANKKDILRNYIDCLNASGQSKKALSLMDKLEQEYPPVHLHDSIVRASTYICIWLNRGNMDSVKVHLEQLEHCCELIPLNDNDNAYRTSYVYVAKLLRSIYAVKKGEALNILDIYSFCEKVASAERRKVAIEKERLFVQNQLKQKNLLLKIKEEQSRRLVLYILSVAGCLVFFLAYLYQRKLLKKERSLRQMKEQMRLHQIALSEKEQLIRQNEETIKHLSMHQDEQAEVEQIRLENERLQKEKQTLQQDMMRYAREVPEKGVEMEAYERLAEQNQSFAACTKHLSIRLVRQHEALKSLYDGEVRNISAVDWVCVYMLIDEIFNDYTKRLHASFPLLTEEDIQCCCLIKLQLSTSAIARLYSIAPSSVTKRKQRIKERINQTKNGLIGKEQPVDVYLWGF